MSTKKYEVFLKSPFTSQDIEAENEEEAKMRFILQLEDNLCLGMVEANCLDVEEEES